MALWSKRERTPVATVEVALFGTGSGSVNDWRQEGERDAMGYHAVLHFLMYYARLMFFLSFRPAAEELVGWLDQAVLALAGAGDGEPVNVSRNWKLVEAQTDAPRSVWSSQLLILGPGEYKCTDQRPPDPEDADAQAVVLLYLQQLVDTLPQLERAYLALGITGMHQYYAEVQHWNTSKSLHPAPAYGISYARRILHG